MAGAGFASGGATGMADDNGFRAPLQLEKLNVEDPLGRRQVKRLLAELERHNNGGPPMRMMSSSSSMSSLGGMGSTA